MVQVDVYHDPKAASAYLQALGFRMGVGTLAKLRCLGGGPVFCYLGRYPRYREDWLDDWATARMSGPRSSTSQAAA
jgi:hypothetical protein